ncbi:MAG TPA: OpgC domain-containing protein [Alphaproteobacteria bacterium]|nr:OpgC domain-containing protein [Alphaproteobacteria bacterium]
MKRYEILDGFRGYFLVFMLVNHLSFRGGSEIAKFNHAEFGFVQDAQGFIFISGLIVGLYYARGYLKGSAGAMDRKLLARAYLLFRYTLVLLALVFGLALLLPGSEAFWRPYLRSFYEDPAVTAMGAATLLYQPAYMDILPQYILYLLVSPILIRLALKGWSFAVLCGSLFVWLAVQLGLHLPFLTAAVDIGREVDPDFAIRSSFNPFAWQLVFVSGLLLGCAVTSGTFRTEEWFSLDRPAPFLVALGFVVVFFAYRIGFTLDLVPDALARRFRAFDNRDEFSFIYLLNFVALGYVVTWILLCAGKSQLASLRIAGRVLRRIFNWRFLRFIGRHSLQVYAYHVAVVFLVFIVDGRFGPLPEWLKAATTLAGAASLALPAWLHARRKARGAEGGGARTASA